MRSTRTQLVEASRRQREALLRRNLLIRKLHQEGSSLRQIGEASGLSHTAVKLILDALWDQEQGP